MNLDRFTVRLHAMGRLAERPHPGRPSGWRTLLLRAVERIADGVFEAETRTAVAALVDQEIRMAQADQDYRRGAWREEKLLTLKAALLTDAERAEMDALAAEVAASMAAAQGLQ